MIQQFNLFKIDNNIPGLSYVPEYITPDQELGLIDIIDSQNWSAQLKRRVQHYGYKYDYNRKLLIKDNIEKLEIPNWLKNLCIKLYQEKIFASVPDQLIINEYLPGQGIAPHIDSVCCFNETICSLSLNSPCIMNFTIGQYKISKLLEARSLLILSNNSRYNWKHSIASRRFDDYMGSKIARQRRISITFRKIKI